MSATAVPFEREAKTADADLLAKCAANLIRPAVR